MPLRTSILLLTLLAVAALPLKTHAFPLYDSPFLTFDAANEPWVLALGDMNEDGLIDVVTANSTSNSVSVFPGLGDLTLGPRLDAAVGAYPYSIELKDFNGDDHLDAVVANWQGNSVTILRGVGDGTFTLRTDVPLAGPARSAVVGRFNGDAHWDLAVTLRDSNQVAILSGDGSGGFAVSGTFPAGTKPERMAVGDVNEDGAADLIVTNRLSGMSFLAGLGDGLFAAPVALASAAGPWAVTLAHLNADAHLDLASSHSQVLAVSLGNGDGTFQPRTEHATGTAPGPAVAADMNGDATIDLAVAHYIAYADFLTFICFASVFPGDGDGTFGARIDTPAPGTAWSVAAADLDGDGRLDLVSSNRSYSFTPGSVSTFRGNGDGTFGGGLELPTNPGPHRLAFASVNADGIPDIVLTTAGSCFDFYGSTLATRIGNGDGTFGPAIVTTTGNQNYCPADMAVADFNEDGLADVAETAGGIDGVGVRLGIGNGTFGSRVDHGGAGRGKAGLAIADFDRDGALDIILSNAADGMFNLLFGTGTGTFDPPVVLFAPRIFDFLTAVDANLDTYPDLAGVTDDHFVVLLNNGSGFFGAPQSYSVGPYSSSAGFGDMDGDLFPEAIVSSETGLSLFRNEGNGTFVPAGNLAMNGGAGHVVVADVNGDGLRDALATSSPGGVVFLPGLGDGNFGPRMHYGTGVGTSRIALGDVNSDGRPDVAVVRSSAAAVTVIENTNTVSAVLERPEGGGVAGRLLSVQPNPMAAAATLAFAMLSPGRAQLEIYDLAGRRLGVLLDRVLPAGTHGVAWDGKADGGRRLKPGMYFARLQAGGQASAIKVLLVK